MNKQTGKLFYVDRLRPLSFKCRPPELADEENSLILNCLDGLQAALIISYLTNKQYKKAN